MKNYLYITYSKLNLRLLVCLIVLAFLTLPMPNLVELKRVNAKQKTKQIKKPNDNKKVRSRNIKWPDGCAFVAQENDEFYFENACAEAIQSIKKWPNDCDYSFPKDLYNGNRDIQGKIKFYPLSLGKYLAEFNCSSGAYNEINFYLFYDETLMPAKAEILEFKSYDIGGSGVSLNLNEIKEKTETLIFGKYFNPKTKELIMLRKYRGMGDCGEWAIYSFSDGKPILKEYLAKTDCDGKNVISYPTKRPIGWTKVYP